MAFTRGRNRLLFGDAQIASGAPIPWPSGWLPGFSYRKEITASRPSGAVTDYQIRILVGYNSSVVGEEVDCNGHCRYDFADLRFTTSDGTTELKYFIENVTSYLATVWVKFDSIGTSATTFYMYYGALYAPFASNGANTFIAFEDFEWGDDEDSITDSGGSITWSSYPSCSDAVIDTAKAFAGSKSARFTSASGATIANTFPLSVSSEVAISFRFWRESSANAEPALAWGNGTNRITILGDAEGDITHYGEGATDGGLNLSEETWQKIEVYNANFSAQTFSYMLNDSGTVNATGMYTNGDFNNVFALIAVSTPSKSVWYDQLFVRKWLSTPPTITAWGDEETPS